MRPFQKQHLQFDTSFSSKKNFAGLRPATNKKKRPFQQNRAPNRDPKPQKVSIRDPGLLIETQVAALPVPPRAMTPVPSQRPGLPRVPRALQLAPARLPGPLVRLLTYVSSRCYRVSKKKRSFRKNIKIWQIFCQTKSGEMCSISSVAYWYNIGLILTTVHQYDEV